MKTTKNLVGEWAVMGDPLSTQLASHIWAQVANNVWFPAWTPAEVQVRNRVRDQVAKDFVPEGNVPF